MFEMMDHLTKFSLFAWFKTVPPGREIIIEIGSMESPRAPWYWIFGSTTNCVWGKDLSCCSIWTTVEKGNLKIFVTNSCSKITWKTSFDASHFGIASMAKKGLSGLVDGNGEYSPYRFIEPFIILQSLNFVRKETANAFSAWSAQSSTMHTIPWNCDIYRYTSRPPFTSVMLNAAFLVNFRGFLWTRIQIVRTSH